MKDYSKSILRLCWAFFLCALGIYLTIRANLGVSPWDVFAMGLSKTLGLQYGTANVGVGILILVMDVLLGGKIGIGTVLNTLLIGKMVDVLLFVAPIPAEIQLGRGLFCLLLGEAVMALGTMQYMKEAQGCGPRDTLMVTLGRRFPRLPIGAVRCGIEATVTLLGFLLGGTAGIGTLIFVVTMGPIMNLLFRQCHFHATQIRHEDMLTTCRRLRATASVEGKE